MQIKLELGFIPCVFSSMQRRENWRMCVGIKGTQTLIEQKMCGAVPHLIGMATNRYRFNNGSN